MIYQYVVTLKNTNSKYVDIFSVLLLLVSSLFFFKEQLHASHIKIAYFLGAIAILSIVVYNFFQQKKYGQQVFYKTALFIASIVWVTMPYFSWLFIPFALMGLFEKQAKMPLEIGFSNNKIIINTLIRRIHFWAEFNNIILKDNLLTLDFKNDKLLQKETIDEESDVEHNEFNQYCQQQLNNI